MRKNCTRSMLAGLVALSAALSLGCATNLRKPEGAPQPTKVKFSTFQSVGLKTVVVDPKFVDGNEKARKKIDELLVAKMKFVFPNLKLVDEKGLSDTKDIPALIIEPVIEEIKFIGGAARFWVGAMAGSSAVLMKVTYTDSATGDVVAAPEFYQASNAMGGGYSMGATDNRMLDDIVQEIVMYTKLNL